MVVVILLKKTPVGSNKFTRCQTKWREERKKFEKKLHFSIQNSKFTKLFPIPGKSSYT